jgi:ribosomal protein L11 methyltransferase
MNDIFLDIHIAVPPDEELRQILPAALSELGFDGFSEDERGIHCFIKKGDWYDSIEHILKDLSEQLNLPFIQLLSISEIVNQNWNEKWEQSIKPIHVSDRIVITPSWHPIEDKDKIVITIDPKMTFGTGYHESTRLMLRLMEQNVQPGSRVLDVGTGTGILAIVSIKLGAKHAVGIDLDEWTKMNGEENVERNAVSEHVEIRIGSLDVVNEPSFDLILANIIRNTILELMDGLIAKLSPTGMMLLSGLLVTDREPIEKALNQRNFHIIAVLQENEWIAIAARRV